MVLVEDQDLPFFSNGICGVYHYCRGVNSNVKISGNTTFIGNSAVFGGGVSIMSSSSVDICLLITHLVEESMQHPIAVWTSMETTLSLLTQQLLMVVESVRHQ